MNESSAASLIKDEVQNIVEVPSDFLENCMKLSRIMNRFSGRDGYPVLKFTGPPMGERYAACFGPRRDDESNKIDSMASLTSEEKRGVDILLIMDGVLRGRFVTFINWELSHIMVRYLRMVMTSAFLGQTDKGIKEIAKKQFRKLDDSRSVIKEVINKMFNGTGDCLLVSFELTLQGLIRKEIAKSQNGHQSTYVYATLERISKIAFLKDRMQPAEVLAGKYPQVPIKKKTKHPEWIAWDKLSSTEKSELTAPTVPRYLRENKMVKQVPSPAKVVGQNIFMGFHVECLARIIRDGISDFREYLEREGRCLTSLPSDESRQDVIDCRMDDVVKTLVRWKEVFTRIKDEAQIITRAKAREIASLRLGTTKDPTQPKLSFTDFVDASFSGDVRDEITNRMLPKHQTSLDALPQCSEEAYQILKDIADGARTYQPDLMSETI